MSPTESVSTCFKKYATFDGRASRPEYWWWVLFQVVLFIVVAIIFAVIAPKAVFAVYVVFLALLLPSIAVTVRRLHDTGRSGWWYFISLVPLVGGIILLVFTCEASHGPNQYGPPPAGYHGTSAGTWSPSEGSTGQ